MGFILIFTFTHNLIKQKIYEHCKHSYQVSNKKLINVLFLVHGDSYHSVIDFNHI